MSLQYRCKEGISPVGFMKIRRSGSGEELKNASFVSILQGALSPADPVLLDQHFKSRVGQMNQIAICAQHSNLIFSHIHNRPSPAIPDYLCTDPHI